MRWDRTRDLAAREALEKAIRDAPKVERTREEWLAAPAVRAMLAEAPPNLADDLFQSLIKSCLLERAPGHPGKFRKVPDYGVSFEG